MHPHRHHDSRPPALLGHSPAPEEPLRGRVGLKSLLEHHSLDDVCLTCAAATSETGISKNCEMCQHNGCEACDFRSNTILGLPLLQRKLTEMMSWVTQCVMGRTASDLHVKA